MLHASSTQSVLFMPPLMANCSANCSQSSENTFDFIYLPVSWEIVFFFSNKQTTVGLTALAKNFLGMFCSKISSDKEQKFYGGILSLVLVIFR